MEVCQLSQGGQAAYAIRKAALEAERFERRQLRQDPAMLIVQLQLHMPCMAFLRIGILLLLCKTQNEPR